MELEEQFNVTIPDEVSENILTGDDKIRWRKRLINLFTAA